MQGDKKLYFNFNNIHSSAYGLFIKNDGEDHKIVNNSGSNEFASPMFQNIHYYIGTNRNQKNIVLNVAAKEISFSAYKKMMRWLQAGERGEFFFDYNPYYSYDVVIGEVDETTHYGDLNSLIVEFQITFNVIGNGNAIGRVNPITRIWDANDALAGDEITTLSQSGNEFGIPEIIKKSYSEDGNKGTIVLYINKITNCEDYFVLTSTLQNASEEIYEQDIRVNDILLYRYCFKFVAPEVFKVFSQYGLSIMGDRIIESLANVTIEEIQNEGVVALSGEETRVVKYDENDGESITFSSFPDIENFYICGLKGENVVICYFNERTEDDTYDFSGKISIGSPQDYSEYSWYVGSYNEIKIEFTQLNNELKIQIIKNNNL